MARGRPPFDRVHWQRAVNVLKAHLLLKAILGVNRTCVVVVSWEDCKLYFVLLGVPLVKNSVLTLLAASKCLVGSGARWCRKHFLQSGEYQLRRLTPIGPLPATSRERYKCSPSTPQSRIVCSTAG